MRNLILATLLLFCSYSFAQTSRNSIIDTNDIAAGFSANGVLFQNVDSGKPTFNVPKNIFTYTPLAIFDGFIPITGLNNGNLYCSTVSQGHYFINTDFYQAGPSNVALQDTVSWDYIWKIYRTDVLAVKNDFDSNHAITQPVPPDVLTWPANGNASATGKNGASLLINEDMAPFVDRNGDGIYNVYDGDYPLIRGDQMLWWINNDNTSTDQNPMGVDRRYSVYEYNSPSDSNLNNTLFLSVKFRNSSGRNYDSVMIGTYIDFDLGCSNNDRVGSIPAQNSFFTYNGYVSGATQLNGVTCDEGTVCLSAQLGYGCNLPILSATFLNDSMRCFTYFTNGAISSQADPTTDSGYYYYMTGRWNDGSPMTFDGTGYGGNTTYPFAFPGNPNDAAQWSECNQQTGPAIQAGDRRSMAAIGPFTLPAGDTISFDMALIFHPGPYDNCPCISDTCDVIQHIDSIRQYYASERFPQWYDSTKALTPAFYNVGIHEIASGPVFTVVPNPNAGSFNIHLSNPGSDDYSITVTDMLGRVMYYNPDAHAPDQSVQMANASSGVYSVTIETQNYKATKKVVITKQ